VAYHLDIANDVQVYLRSLTGLSRQGRVKLYANLQHLRNLADSYRNDPVNRLAPNSPYLWYTILFQDDDGSMQTFRFMVNDSGAAYGVLQVVYVDRYVGFPGP
jgi:hypothetical protein